MNLCHVCKKITKSGKFTYKGVFICQECSIQYNEYLFDEFRILDGEIHIMSPISHADEKQNRLEAVDYIYNILNHKVSKAFFSQLKNLLKRPDYTYLGIARAVEYHFVIKKNSIEKAKGGIGIVPYVYEQAQAFYEQESRTRHEKFRKFLIASKNEQKTQEVEILEETNKKEIDMSQL